MSTQQSSSIRVKGSKNPSPWNKKKNIKKPKQSNPNNNNKNNTKKKQQKQQQQQHSVSQINDTEQWPDLTFGAKMNINTAPKKATETIISPTKSLSNRNNTGSSTPNIKYKSNQNQETQSNNIKTELNGYNANNISLPQQSFQQKQKQQTKTTTPTNTNPNSVKSNKSNTSSKSSTISTDNTLINKTNKSIKSSSISIDSSITNTNDISLKPNSNSPKKTKKRRRKSKSKSSPNSNNNNTPNKTQSSQPSQPSQPPNTSSSKSSTISTDSSISISPQNKTNNNTNNNNKNNENQSNQPQETQQTEHTQTNLNGNNNSNHNDNNDLPPRSYHSFPRRPNRGKRRGRGRGRGYRNNYYDNEQSQSPSNNNYQRNPHRNNYRNNNNRRGSYRGNGGPPPRHNKEYNNNNRGRYREHNNNNNNNMNNMNNMNNINPNQYNNDQFNNTNTNLWNQPQLPNGYNFMAVPLIPIHPYPIQTIGTPQTIQSPGSDNKDINNNNNNNEGDTERKSDTTTTTSNSTIPNGNNSNSNNTTPTPGGTTIGTATAITAPIMNINSLYNPYTTFTNPYLMGLTPNISNIMMNEPPEHIHLSINQMQKPPQWNGEINLPLGPYYVLKVSCVATGYNADDRSVGHIALIDWNLKTKANVFVKPQQQITSYIEPLTSLNKDLLDKYGYPLDAAINIIKSELPTDAVLIGQNITMDLQWLGLKHNEDFRAFVDLRDIWRSWSEYYKSYTHYSLTHQAKCILNVQNADQQKHSASFDGMTTMKLFQYYVWCRYYNMQLFQTKINTLQNTKISPSFAKKNPVFEGVQMQSKKYKGVPYITAKPKMINSTNNNMNNTDNTDNDKNNDNNDNNNNNNNKQTIFVNPPKSLDAAKAE